VRIINNRVALVAPDTKCLVNLVFKRLVEPRNLRAGVVARIEFAIVLPLVIQVLIGILLLPRPCDVRRPYNSVFGIDAFEPDLLATCRPRAKEFS